MKAKRSKAKKKVAAKKKGATRKKPAPKKPAPRKARTSTKVEVNTEALKRAEAFSKQHSTTVSSLIDSYLFELTRDHSEEEPSALVRELYKRTTEGHTTGEYKGHLWKKHVLGGGEPGSEEGGEV